MADERIKKIAEILVDYSIDLKKGDNVVINAQYEAKDLIIEIYKRIIQKGGLARININIPGMDYNYYRFASEEQLMVFPEVNRFEAEKCDSYIRIGAESNTKEMSTIDPKKMSSRRKILKPISDIVHKKKWVIFDFPTNALAQDAEMSLDEFEDFVYSACIKDWKTESKKQDKLKAIIDKGKTVRIVGKDTDLTFSIVGRKGVKCDGKYNMPDGEVFTSPVDDSANGHIAYSFPAIYMGKEVDGIKLWFKEGKVIKATAEKNEDMLKAMLDTDEGAKRLGEFGIGVNYEVKRFVKQILFDEKLGGTIHLALGESFPEALGKNKSAIHWDMIKDLRDGGAIYVDGKCIQKDGKFTFKL